MSEIIPTPEALPEAVRAYVRESIAPNTRRAYRADLDHFTAWGGTIPCGADVVARYLAEHAEVLSVATLSRRIATISKAHTAKGLPSPTTAQLVQSILRGIKRAHTSAQRAAKPLLIEDLTRIMGTLGETPKDVRDRALLLIGFAGGFRRSELVAINCNDLEWARQGLIIHLRRSKTDQTGEGRKVGIPFARGRYCPVHSLEAWLQLSGIEAGPVFRPVNRHGRVMDKRLSGEAVATVIKERVASIGLDPDGYSGHSLRAGLATSAAMAGVSTLAIRQQTGHRSDAMLARYVRAGELFTNNAAWALL